MANYTIAGHSDDLIYIHNHNDNVTIGEYDAYETVATIETKDGWKYTFEYAGSFWTFELVETGTGLEPTLTKATDEVTDYSDTLVVYGDFSLIIKDEVFTVPDGN